MLTHDILIRGAGPAGSTLALLLARVSRNPQRIALIGDTLPGAPDPVGASPTAEGSAQPGTRDTGATPDTGASAEPGQANTSAVTARQPDPRTLALNHGSRTLLETLDAWPQHSADIHTVHVSQRGRLGRTVIDHRDLKVPRLGSVVSYDGLLTHLHERVRQSGIELITATTPRLELHGEQLLCDLGTRQLRAALAVQSDGRRPERIVRHYGQSAVLTTVSAEQPRPGWAWERFTRHGPLALLPHPQGGASYAVVWCCPQEQAAELRELPLPAFDDALNHCFGDRLGVLRTNGDRHVLPLALHAGPTLLNARTIAIGNAAQTLHPVAGQGLNLGLRDVAQLALSLSAWQADPHSDPRAALVEFRRRRQPDRWLTGAITDLLPRVFSTGHPMMEHTCGLALLGLDLIGPVRRILARQLLQGMRS